MENFIKVILFLSSYIPLFIIIIIQNVFSLLKELKVKIDFKISNTSLIIDKLQMIFIHFEFYVSVFLIVLIVILLLLVRKLVKSLNDNDLDVVKLSKVVNINHSTVTNYFAVYIFPFITMDLTSLLGAIQFIFLGSIIGYIYIKNDLIYINPVLNILFNMNIYEVEIMYSDENSGDTLQEGILLSIRTKKQLAVGDDLKIIVKDSDLFFNVK